MAETLIPAVSDVITLRAKNQLTLPEALARQLDVAPGDRFRAWVRDDGTLALRKSGDAYGKYKGVWGDTPEEVEEHLQELRDEWERDRPWY